MDYEKKYKDNFELARDWYNDQSTTKKEKVLLENLFPELAESEDERIRKAIVSFIDEMKGDFDSYEDIKLDEMVAWLEKQGEQNPVWSKEDITNYSKVLFCLQTLTFPTDAERKELITWLKKQCEQSSTDWECKAKREAEQKPTWSEEDEELKNSTILYMQGMLEGAAECENIDDIKEFNKIISWLKSIKDRVQPHWKPTDEQLSALYWVITSIQLEEEDEETLKALYKLLKKL